MKVEDFLYQPHRRLIRRLHDHEGRVREHRDGEEEKELIEAVHEVQGFTGSGVHGFGVHGFTGSTSTVIIRSL